MAYVCGRKHEGRGIGEERMKNKDARDKKNC
jgi:hypothetical protein